MESFVVDVPTEPYVEMRPLPFREFEVDLDATIVETPLRERVNSESTVDDGSPVVLTWRDLNVFAFGGKKQLLHNLSGKVSSGFYAIMGPSGSGKSTLLNTLSCRLDSNMTCNGDVRLNGMPYTNKELKWMSAYVMQDDLLNGQLTVEETLTYAAELRMDRGTPHTLIMERVEAVMHEMNVLHVRNVIIGTPLRKGISGGERKRVCVAMELLTRPLLLFLDEPTSGLDSVAALSLCTKLKELTDARTCTVMCTIHQPQAKIFKLFDNLVLMNKGHIVFQGPSSRATQFFCVSGFPIPQHENPADHFLDVISATTEKQLQAPAPKVDLSMGQNRPRFLPRDQTPWTQQFFVLFRRSMKEQWRKRDIIAVLMAQSVVMAILIGTVFLKIGTGQDSIVRRAPVLFFCCINQGIFGSLLTINSFPSERVLVLRERAAGTYFVSAYFLAKTTAETLTTLGSPIVFSITVYWLVGFQVVASKFILFTIIMTLCSLAATSLALVVSTWCRTTDLSVAVLPLGLEITRLFGGFFLSPANLPVYFKWLDALSYIKYAYVGISLNELEGLTYTCTDAQRVVVNGTSTTCPIVDGQQTISTLGLDFLTVGDCIGVLISFLFFCRFVAYLGLRFLKS